MAPSLKRIQRGKRRATIMFAKLRHIAVMTENWDRMAKFYQTIFGMKKITNGMTDENGNYNKERGHLSDGVIGLALLQRQPGFRSGFDHFGLEVDDVQKVRDRLKQFYPDVYIAQSQSHVPFCVFRSIRPVIPKDSGRLFRGLRPGSERSDA